MTYPRKLARAALGATVMLAALAVAAPAYAAPANDAIADATLVPTPPQSLQQSTAGATTEAGEPSPSCATTGASVWFKLSPASSASVVTVKTFGSKFDTVLAVYTVAPDSTLTELACNDDVEELGSVQSQLRASIPAGATALVMAGGYEGASGSLKIAFGTLGLDQFEGAMDIAALPFEHTVSNTTFGAEPGEPGACGVDASKTAWFRYAPAADGIIEVSTAGSDFDTVLGIYRGGSLAALDEVVCSDDAVGVTSRAVASVTAGEVYHIQIDGFFGDSGTIRLGARALSAPANDGFANAITISEVPAEVGGSNLGATMEGLEPSSDCWITGSTVWYRFVAPKSGPLVARADSDDGYFYPITAVYRGGSLEELGEESCGWPEDGAGFSAEEGETYWIQVGSSWFDEHGTFTLTVRYGFSRYVETLVTAAAVNAETDGDDHHAFVYTGLPLSGALVEAERGPDGGEVTACAGVVIVGDCVTAPTP